MKPRPVVAVLVALFLLLPATASAGTIVADTGFRPAPNGFSFPNYGDEDGYANLDATDMQRLFGPAVCTAGKGARCLLTPLARLWMESENRGMADGHCFGFATLTELIYDGRLPQFGFGSLDAFRPGARAPFELSIADSVRLQRAIARAFVFQSLPEVADRSVSGAPRKVLTFLVRAMTTPGTQPWTMTIFQSDGGGGHAITPYAVEDMGGGLFDVHVYDNNWPGDTGRRLHVNVRDNTWSYYGAIKPGIGEAVYEGDAKTDSLGLAPTRNGLGTHPCWFCFGRQGRGSRYNEIRLDGSAVEHADLTIVDSQGRKTGVVRGRLVNQIPGAKIARRTSQSRPTAGGDLLFADDPVPIFRVPKNVKFRIGIDGRGLNLFDRETLTLVGPTYDATVENLVMGPGQVANVSLSRRGRALTYRSSRRSKTPTVTFGAETKRAVYRVTAAAVGAPRGSSMTFVKHPRRQLMWLGDNTGERRRYRIAIEGYTLKGRAPSRARTFAIAGDRRAFLYYGPLDGGKGVPKIVVYNAAGKLVRVIPLPAGKS